MDTPSLEKDSVLFAAIGEFVVRFSHMHSTLEVLTAHLISWGGDASSHRRATSAIAGMTAQPLVDAFFAVLEEAREVKWSDADAVLVKACRKEINALITERNRIAHDVWSLGHPNFPRPSDDSWHRVRSVGSPSTGHLFSNTPFNAPYLQNLSQSAVRLAAVARVLAVAGTTASSYSPGEHLHWIQGPDGATISVRDDG